MPIQIRRLLIPIQSGMCHGQIISLMRSFINPEFYLMLATHCPWTNFHIVIHPYIKKAELHAVPPFSDCLQSIDEVTHHIANLFRFRYLHFDPHTVNCQKQQNLVFIQVLCYRFTSGRAGPHVDKSTLSGR